VGDKGGKKDKAENKQQQVTKQKQEEQRSRHTRADVRAALADGASDRLAGPGGHAGGWRLPLFGARVTHGSR